MVLATPLRGAARAHGFGETSALNAFVMYEETKVPL